MRMACLLPQVLKQRGLKVPNKSAGQQTWEGPWVNLRRVGADMSSMRPPPIRRLLKTHHPLDCTRPFCSHCFYKPVSPRHVVRPSLPVPVCPRSRLPICERQLNPASLAYRSRGAGFSSCSIARWPFHQASLRSFTLRVRHLHCSLLSPSLDRVPGCSLLTTAGRPLRSLTDDHFQPQQQIPFIHRALQDQRRQTAKPTKHHPRNLQTSRRLLRPHRPGPDHKAPFLQPSVSQVQLRLKPRRTTECSQPRRNVANHSVIDISHLPSPCDTRLRDVDHFDLVPANKHFIPGLPRNLAVGFSKQPTATAAGITGPSSTYWTLFCNIPNSSRINPSICLSLVL